MDTGGTFTDCMATSPGGKTFRLKVLSSGLLRLKILKRETPDSLDVFPIAWLNGKVMKNFCLRLGEREYKIKDILENRIFLTKKIVDQEGCRYAEITSKEEVPVFAARILTQTPLNKAFPKVQLRLGSTRGTNALLENKGSRTALLVTKGFKDLLAIGYQNRPSLFSLNIEKEKNLYDFVVEVEERIEANGKVLKPLTKKEMERIVGRMKTEKIESVAIAFLNSYAAPVHEKMMGTKLKEAGYEYVSLSHQLSSQIKIINRAQTAVVNAYLSPIIRNYIEGIQRGLKSISFSVLSSSGGLIKAGSFFPKDSLLSGPAGGVMGALSKAMLLGKKKIITFDMGGTSTDVSLCDGRPDYRLDCTIGQKKIFSPSIGIETIAAGGGSICDFDGHQLRVGPHSAGSEPGPASYGKGGPLTLTDINLLLGRLDEENFSIPILHEEAEKRLEELIVKIRAGSSKAIKRERVMEGCLQIANEKMAEAIRKVSVGQGREVSDYALVCYGGAGGQHVCDLATMLGVKTIVLPSDAGLLSAYGIGQAMHEKIQEKVILKTLAECEHLLDGLFKKLINETKQYFKKEGHRLDDLVVLNQFLFLRFFGQDSSIEIEFSEGINIKKIFKAEYKKHYGHWMNKMIEVEFIRVRVGIQEKPHKESKGRLRKTNPTPLRSKKIWLENQWRPVPLFDEARFDPGIKISGPALILNSYTTLFVARGWNYLFDGRRQAILQANLKTSVRQRRPLKEANLELFSNRFSSIAREMGAILQHTSFSVNVKERLDFSCAILNPRGYLVVNAPHIPVHLGSLGICVRALLKKVDLKPGDVYVTNDPSVGGSHLPDITLVKPVFYGKALVGFVANRAHHAEIGGTQPGSMPAHAKTLAEEGVLIRPMTLISGGEARWEKMERIFLNSPYPSRAVHENLADLRGGVSALQLGERALLELCEQHGLAEVKRQMNALGKRASGWIKEKIKKMGPVRLKARERLDDGSVLSVEIRTKGEKMDIDFGGSSGQHPGNLNATLAIVNSVVLYVLRLWLDRDLPLNEGMLESVSLHVPRGILNPLFKKDPAIAPAVVGGNTEISQRLTDTLLKALDLAACSQGTMNNFLFGNDKFGYYETLCGGTGAGKGFDGADAVHQHMTNTLITDPEILESRYPVRLEKFSIRKDSGGLGKWKGGNGVERMVFFKEHVEINLLSQHRKKGPYGKHGGGLGKPGRQWLIRKDGKIEKLAGIDSVTINPGDRLVIQTPGGGGWGKV